MGRKHSTKIGEINAHNVGLGKGSTVGDTHVTQSETPSIRYKRPSDTPLGKRVFVIYGRDDAAQHMLFELIDAIGLLPLPWEALVAASGSASPFIGQVVGDAPLEAQAVVALLTPDDSVRLHSSLVKPHDGMEETRSGCQARPNVYYELGLAMAIHPDRTVIVTAGTMRPVADLAGRNYVRIDDNGSDPINKLADRLRNAGCAVDINESRRARLNPAALAASIRKSEF